MQTLCHDVFFMDVLSVTEEIILATPNDVEISKDKGSDVKLNSNNYMIFKKKNSITR